MRDNFDETNENYASGRYAIKLRSLTLIKLGSTWNLGEVSTGLSSLCTMYKQLVPCVASLLPDRPTPPCVYSLFICQSHCFVFKLHKVGTTYGRKMMGGYKRHSTDLRLGAHSVGRALKRVNPQQYRERQTSITCHLNPVPYFAEYFGNKLHLDQNEKLVRYGVT